MDSKLPIAIRNVFPEEHNFILNSWIKSGYRSKTLEPVAKEIYTLNQHEVISSLLVRSKVIVAQELNNPENIYGYICYDYIDGIFVLHYAYTKQIYRNLEIFKHLLQHAAKDNPVTGFYTHHTKVCEKIMPKLNLLYNPYLLINPKFNPMLKNPERKLENLKLKKVIEGDFND